MEYKLFVDEKVTIWRRATVVTEAESLEDAVQRCLDCSYDEECVDYLYDTEDCLNPSNNGGRSTFEIMNEHDDLIYSNRDVIDRNS